MTTTLGLDRLKELFAHLPKNTRETVRRCWGSFELARMPCNIMVGIKDAAIYYAEALSRERERPKDSHRKAPHEVASEMMGIASTAMDLKRRLEKISRESLVLIENRSIQAAQPSTPSLDWFNEENCTLCNANLHGWFQMRRGHYCEDGSLEEDEPRLGQDGMKSLELEALAAAIEMIAKDAEARKEAPNGARMKVSGRNRPLENLLFHIGSMVLTEDRQISHVLPIARKVHEWATGDPVGEDWGIRPYKAIKSHFQTPAQIEQDFCPGPPY